MIHLAVNVNDGFVIIFASAFVVPSEICSADPRPSICSSSATLFFMKLSEAPVSIKTSASWSFNLALITAGPKFAGAAAMENDFSTPTEQSKSEKHLSSRTCKLLEAKAQAAEPTNTSSETCFASDLHTLAKCPRLLQLWQTAFTAGQERRFACSFPPQKKYFRTFHLLKADNEQSDSNGT